MKRYYLEDIKKWLSQKRIAVVGAGISNRPLINWLYQFNSNISIFDQMEEDNPRLVKIKNEYQAQDINLSWSTGADYLKDLSGFDLIFRTPIMRPDHPALIKAREEGAQISSEMSLFLSLCPSHVTGITGSNGKTTTTSLIGKLYEAAGKRVYVGGNIGTPLLDQVFFMAEDDEVVVELSSFQLFDLVTHLDTAVITNISPNHLDIHKDYEEYAKVKKSIFKSQRPFDRLVLNYEDELSRSYLSRSGGEIVWFNNKDFLRGLKIWLEDGTIWQKFNGEDKIPLIKKEDVLLPGRFNLDNYMAAWAAVTGRIEEINLHKVASSFKGVPHRMELIRELNDILWYNSSIDSTPSRTINTLTTIAEQGRPIILICGGRDKDLDYEELGEVILNTVDHLIYCGENSDLIKAALARSSRKKQADQKSITSYDAYSYEEAVNYASSIAKAGDLILLSPTGTSFDRFFNFEERGEYFRKLVNAL